LKSRSVLFLDGRKDRETWLLLDPVPVLTCVRWNISICQSCSQPFSKDFLNNFLLFAPSMHLLPIRNVTKLLRGSLININYMMTTTIYLLFYSGVTAKYIYSTIFFWKVSVQHLGFSKASSYVTLMHHVDKEKTWETDKNQACTFRACLDRPN